jgi:hypothetical protein
MTPCSAPNVSGPLSPYRCHRRMAPSFSSCTLWRYNIADEGIFFHAGESVSPLEETYFTYKEMEELRAQQLASKMACRPGTRCH